MPEVLAVRLVSMAATEVVKTETLAVAAAGLLALMRQALMEVLEVAMETTPPLMEAQAGELEAL